jgi:hypothetical protein
LGDPGDDGKIILTWIFKKWDVEVAVAQFVKALRYKPGGRGFDSQ